MRCEYHGLDNCRARACATAEVLPNPVASAVRQGLGVALADAKDGQVPIVFHEVTGHVRIEHFGEHTRVLVNGVDVSDVVVAVEWSRVAGEPGEVRLRMLAEHVSVIEEHAIMEIVDPSKARP